MRADMLPCPFCGGEPDADLNWDDEHWEVSVRCNSCEACGPAIDQTGNDNDVDELAAISAWNKRI